MISIMFLCIVITIIVGLVAKSVLDQLDGPYKITWLEFSVASVICCFIITPIVVKVGWELAKSSKLTYNEYWNGWEVSADIYSTTCHKNGSCRQTYECDPHQVSYSCNCRRSCSGSGKNQSCHETCDTCYRTEYDDCPYVDKEYDYSVKTTLGDYSIDTHRFPLNPQQHRWRESKDIPDRVIENAGVGAPPFWIEVDKRIQDGKPGYMTKVSQYKNLIYATEKNIFKQYSGEIQKYKTDGLLPNLSTGVRDFYKADKVYFVGLNTPDKNMWNERLSYLNSAIGSELQGDLHLVLVDSSKIINPDEYIIALKAYWQNPENFGRNALSKNTIVVILGTDGKTITWSKGFTGMPLGNEEMITELYSLKGANFDPINILGNVQQVNKKGGFEVVHSLGLLENIIYGFEKKQTKFKRISMERKDKTGRGGFAYLMSEIEPSDSGKLTCISLCILLSCIGWMIVGVIDLDNLINKNYNKRRW